MTTVRDVMNPELFSTRLSDDVGETLAIILRLGITAAPVVDEEGTPVGVISLRDLAAACPGDVIGTHMTTPARTIAGNAGIEEAARSMGSTEYHHLVVVGANGHAIGFVSALDLLRAMVGVASAHPPAFHEVDRATGLSWTGPLPLDARQVAAAPKTAGLVTLMADGLGRGSEVVWTEASANLHGHLERLVAGKIPLPEELRQQVRDGGLSFKLAEFDRGGRSLAEKIGGKG